MKALLFLLGCSFAFVAFLDLTGRVLETIKTNDRWKLSLYTTMFWGFLSISMWTVFYVLTHQ